MPATVTHGAGRLRLGWPMLAPSVRVWAFTMGLAALGLVLLIGVIPQHTVETSRMILPWPLIALGFCVAELKVVDVHFKREQHSFSLSEFPAVIGLFLLPPHEYIVAVLVGSAAALAWSRQSPLKFVFNLTNFGLGATAAVSIFHILATTSASPSPIDWLAAFAATLTTTVLSALTIASAISLSGGAPQYQKLPQMIQFGGPWPSQTPVSRRSPSRS